MQRRYTCTNDIAKISTAVVLNYALALEHLQSAFYIQGMKNFTPADFSTAGFHESVYDNIQNMAKDELTHVEYLTKAITGKHSWSNQKSKHLQET